MLMIRLLTEVVGVGGVGGGAFTESEPYECNFRPGDESTSIAL